MNKRVRYISLFDEIKYHVFNWVTEEDWKKLPVTMRTSMETLINEIKAQEIAQKVGINAEEENTTKKDRIYFFELFKRKYLEFTDMNYMENLSPLDKVNIERVIGKLKEEGANYMDFIEWYFDDFCSLESNKEYMPPRVSGMCMSWIINKYLFIKKDELRIRSNSKKMEELRAVLLKIAMPLVDSHKEENLAKELAKKVVDFSNKKISAKKFLTLLTAYAEKWNDEKAIEECNKLSGKEE